MIIQEQRRTGPGAGGGGNKRDSRERSNGSDGEFHDNVREWVEEMLSRTGSSWGWGAISSALYTLLRCRIFDEAPATRGVDRLERLRLNRRAIVEEVCERMGGKMHFSAAQFDPYHSKSDSRQNQYRTLISRARKDAMVLHVISRDIARISITRNTHQSSGNDNG